MFSSNIDIRDNVDGLMKRFGMKALLIRDARHTRCTCYNAVHKCGDPKCKKCKGTGRFSSVELIDILYQNIMITDMMKMTEYGLVNIDSFRLFIKCNIAPNENDIVLIVGFDKHKMPVDIKELLHAKTTRPFRGDDGRIEYHEMICQHKPQLLDREQGKLNELSLTTKKKIMNGGRHIWR